MTPEQAIEKFDSTICVLLEQIESEVVLDCNVSIKQDKLQVDEGISYNLFFGLPGTFEWDANVEIEIDICEAWDGNVQGKTIRFSCVLYLGGKEATYVRPTNIKPTLLSNDKSVESTFDLFKSMIDVPKIAGLISEYLKNKGK